MDAGVLALGATSAAFPGTFAHAWTGSEASGTRLKLICDAGITGMDCLPCCAVKLCPNSVIYVWSSAEMQTKQCLVEN